MLLAEIAGSVETKVNETVSKTVTETVAETVNRTDLDPGWERYFHWPPSHFPIQFPACRVTLETVAHEAPDEALITWTQVGSVPLLGRVVGAGGELIHELPPRVAEEEAGTWSRRLTIPRARWPEGIGLAFSWWFYVPPIERVPQHPMGVVLGGADFLFGRHSRIRVTAQGRLPKVQ